MKAKDFIKSERIIKVSPEDTIASAVSQLNSSHDAAFVFIDNHYAGVINPYYSLIKNNRSNGDSLVKHFLYHPPRIHPDDPLEKVVGLLMDSRLHYLPVMEGNTFHGVISARRLLEQMKDEQVYNQKVLDALQTKKKAIVSVYEDDVISKIIHLFEEEDVSKLVVLDQGLKLKGIMSYHDLVPYLIAPKERIAMLDEKTANNTDPYGKLKVKNTAQTLVHTLSPDALLADCLTDIVKRGIGSVVILNREGFPVGIITIRDLLRFLTRNENNLVIELSTNNISPNNMDILNEYGPHLERWVQKIKDVSRVTMLVKEEKNGGLFKVTLTIHPKSGKAKTYQVEGKNLLDVLKKINKNRSSSK